MNKSILSGAVYACALGWTLRMFAADSALPWQREIPLREAAASVFLNAVLETNSPYPTMSSGGTDALTGIRKRRASRSM